MTKKKLNWQNIRFAYHQTDKRYVSNFKDGSWNDGELTTNNTVQVHESAGILQYCQEVFEGLKAYETASGEVATPQYSSILPSITRKSLLYVAEALLRLKSGGETD